MIDLHCHVLPGIDDGPRTIDESIALVRTAAHADVRTIVATPHVSPRYPNDADTIARLVDELSSRLTSEGLNVEIHAGAEIAMARILEIPSTRLSHLSLGRGKWLLVEPPFSPLVPALGIAVTDLQREGHKVVLAHPERCPTFHRDPAMLESLVRAGALTSVTAGALVGRFGKDVRNFALDLAGAGMIHNVSSDAHDCHRRPPGAREEIERAGLAWLGEWLTHDVPAAILSGEEIPRRPAGAPARTGKRWRGLRRREDSPARVSRWPRSSG
jgi:protein-tyrosine phosphatase